MKKNIEQIDWSRYWPGPKDWRYLNHGALSRCPKPVLKRQSELRLQSERQPKWFVRQRFPELIDEARKAMADFVGTSADQLVFVPNVTTGVAAIFRSWPLDKTDELLITNQTYLSCRHTVDYLAYRFGFSVNQVEVDFPVSSPDELIEVIVDGVRETTTIALLDHVTSETGVVWPVRKIATRLTQMDVDVVIDGAHAPGMVPLDIAELDSAFYVGSCHKWISAPKGAAFIAFEEEVRDQLVPLPVGHADPKGSDGRTLHDAFCATGTSDPTPKLCVPKALTWIPELVDEDWAAVRERNHRIAMQVQRDLSDALDLPSPAPAEMMGSMASILLDQRLSDDHQTAAAEGEALQRALRARNIEAPVKLAPKGTGPTLRLSVFLYNDPSDYTDIADRVDRHLR